MRTDLSTIRKSFGRVSPQRPHRNRFTTAPTVASQGSPSTSTSPLCPQEVIGDGKDRILLTLMPLFFSSIA